MTKQTKILIGFGIVFLLMPSVMAYAQNTLKNGAILFETSISPQVSLAIERAGLERATQLEAASGLGRAATATPAATMSPMYSLIEHGISNEIKEEKAAMIGVVPKPGRGYIIPTIEKVQARPPLQTAATQVEDATQRHDSSPRTLLRLLENYHLTMPQRQAMIVGASNDMAQIERAVQSGSNPKFIFWGLMAEGSLKFAESFLQKYPIDLNAPILNGQYIVELLPNRRGLHSDPRIAWLLNHGMNPATMLANSIYDNISQEERDWLFKQDLNPAIARRVAPNLIIPSKQIMALVQKYNLTETDGRAIAAGSYRNMVAVERAIQEGAEPKFAFFGAFMQGYLDFAGELLEKYEIDINAPMFNGQHVVELIPHRNKNLNSEQRIKWLLDHGMNPEFILSKNIYSILFLSADDWALLLDKGLDPAIVMEKNIYLSICNEPAIFSILLQKGLNPMAANENGYTALHWYMKRFLTEYEPEVLINWLAQFPDANPNVQDKDGNTPLHYLDHRLHISSEHNRAILSIKGINPRTKNLIGVPAYQGADVFYKHWAEHLGELQEDIKDLIIEYRFPGQELTTGQKIAVEKKAKRLALFPEELPDYLEPLGASRHELLKWCKKRGYWRYNRGERYRLRGMAELEKMLQRHWF